MKRRIGAIALLLLGLIGSYTSYINASFDYKKLTILTQPIGAKNSGVYGGHFAVTRSLIEGLKNLHASFNYNPQSLSEVGDVVYALADVNALIQGIKLRRAGRIKRLIAGPSLFTRANEYNHILASPEIDCYIVNSPWTKQAYIEDEPLLQGRIQIWYAGVDTNFWTPAHIKFNSNKVLVYWKTEEEQFCVAIENLLRAYNYEPIRIRYGNYTKDQYKKILSEVAFAVFISISESQGIALAESWSMDVPTLVWDRQQPLMIAGKEHWPVSAAPYLNDAVGKQWTTLSHLELLLQKMPEQLLLFEPRDWVLKHMSDSVSAQLLLAIVSTTDKERDIYKDFIV